MISLSLHLLGTFHVALQQQLIPQSRAKKIEALLAYLMVEAKQVHLRENLASLFYPEMSEELARTNLRQTLSRLKRIIANKKAASPFLLITRESVQFNSDSAFEVDMLTFQAGLNGCAEHKGQRQPQCVNCMHKLKRVMPLYQGPFLHNFFLGDSPAFEEWILVHRERLHQETLTALQELTNFFERRGAYKQAISYARRQIELEPWYEPAHQQLMRLLVRQGKRNAALAQYETCRTILKQELDVSPRLETKSLLNSICTTKRVQRHNLPSRTTSFFERDEELAQINAFILDPTHCLLTIVGPGGIGKTRLALEAAWQMVHGEALSDGVYFIPLAEVDSADHLVTAVAEELNFPLSGTKDLQQQLIDHLANKCLLLILDNFEHLIPQSEGFITDILNQAPGVKIVVTSRVHLKFKKERPLSIAGLSIPDIELARPHSTAKNDLLTQITATHYGALALFAERACQVDARFDLDATLEQKAAVIRICHLVEGLPLGVELAANWVRSMSCQEIEYQIRQHLDFLQNPFYDMPQRHHSLRATFEHSWNLLTAAEQTALQQLSVFESEFGLKTAVSDSIATVPLLTSLVDKSLVRRVITGHTSEVSYKLPGVVTLYAAEKAGHIA